MLFLYLLIFFISCVFLYISGQWVVSGLMRISRFLGWREFVVSFFVMSFAVSLPNLFVGLISAFNKVPELSFGDVAGNNLIAMTLAVALGVFFSKKKEILVESRVVQITSIFTITAALLPLILVLDGVLSRGDGIILILFFSFYVFWLFSKRERFTKIYSIKKISGSKNFKFFLKDLAKLIGGIFLLILAAQGIVSFAQFFVASFAVPIILVGILITGFGSALPEVYFSIASAKRGETWMILGNLMGCIIFPSTLVLGIVSLIHPIEALDFSSFAIARIFLVLSAIFFLIVIKTGRKITKFEGVFLLIIYFLFVFFQIFFAK